jgi:predicted TIM-barrel fold metal-dependent hydrolase
MIIDSHLHLYSKDAACDPTGWAAARGELGWGACVAPAARPSLQAWATVDELLYHMDEAGVDRAILQGWYWQHQATADEQNDWYQDWIQAHPDRLSAFAAVARPDAPALAATRRRLDAGFIGLGELCPQVHQTAFASLEWDGLMSLAREYRVPVTLHVSDPIIAPPGPAGKTPPLDEYRALARRFPEIRFILAHWGGGLPFYELSTRVSRDLQNVLYDTAASALLYNKAIYRRVCDVIGPERILWGTDYPLLTHPRRARKPGFALDLEDVRTAGLSAHEEALILGGNAARIFGWA